VHIVTAIGISDVRPVSSAKVSKCPKVSRPVVPSILPINIFVNKILQVIYNLLTPENPTAFDKKEDEAPCASHLASVTLLWQYHGYAIKTTPDKCS
jgi:hypothetical protein